MYYIDKSSIQVVPVNKIELGEPSIFNTPNKSLQKLSIFIDIVLTAVIIEKQCFSKN